MTSASLVRNDAGGVAARAIGERALTRAGAPRLDAIDLLRGLVIVLMVLDHVRDYVHAQAFVFDPTDPSRTTPLLFATRWITHLCAPTFVFLSGVSIFLQRANGKDPAILARFLLARGLWLVLLEVTVVSFAFNMGPPVLFLQVIWAIGISMVLMAALVRLSPSWVLALGVIIVSGHPLLASVDAAQLGAWGLLWRLCMEPGPAGVVHGFIAYPFIPWFGVMCVGYGLGSIFRQEQDRRRRSLLVLGLLALTTFVIVRALNLYGDPAAWSAQRSVTGSVLSFMNVSKYPPSLLYVLVTLGTSLLLALPLERLGGALRHVLLAFGRTPLMTYILHVYLVHLLGIALGVSSGLSPEIYFNFFGDPVRHVGSGFSLPWVYAIWLLALVLLYPISRRFARLKSERREWWLSYL
jgi:uncharacterized membrane protein